jgi:hypothetical protein
LPELDSVQKVGLKAPVPVEAQEETVPLGVLVVPASVSVTVAVQVVGALTATEEGEQLTVVEVERLVTVSAKGEPLLLLVACVASPP